MKEEEEMLTATDLSNNSSPTRIIPSCKITDENNEKSTLLNGGNFVEECRQDSPPKNGNLTLNEPIVNGEVQKKDKISGTKEKDESCFKTPALPTNNKKTRPTLNSKKHSKVSADPPVNRKIFASDQTANNAAGVDSQSFVQYTNEELLREFVSIGKHSFLCSRSQQFLAKKYPGLVLRKNNRQHHKDDKQKQQDKQGEQPKVVEEEDMIKEIVIDEFSLLLFHSMDDYNLLKDRENKIKEHEEAQARQKQYEENLRMGKIKKKGRKSKLEMKRAKKEAKKKARNEQKEQRRREHEERRQRKLMQAQGQQQLASSSSLQQQDDKQQQEIRKERRERKETNKLEREKRREEKKRQKQATTKKATDEERQNKEKRPHKGLAVTTPSSSSSASSISINPSILSVPSTSRTFTVQQQHELEISSNAMKIKIEKLDTENQAPIEVKQSQKVLESSIGVKRPSSTAIGPCIGIATVHRNGLIQSPTNNNLLAGMPPSAKAAKLESAMEEYGQPNNNRGLLIGIAVSTASGQQSTTMDSLGCFIENKDAIKNAMEKDFFRTQVSGNGLPSSSNQSKLLQQQGHLQQTLLKNPELAYSFQQSLATLYSIDPSMVARATAAGLTTPGGYPYGSQFDNSNSSIKSATQSIIQNQKPHNDPAGITGSILAPGLSAGQQSLLPTFPLGVPLASQLATLAASQSAKHPTAGAGGSQQNQSIPFKSSRWCNMHAVIASEISKHQDAVKKAAAEGRTSNSNSMEITGGRQSTSSNASGGRTMSHAEKKQPSTTPVHTIQQKVSMNNLPSSISIASSTSITPIVSNSSTAATAQLLQLQQQQQLCNKASATALGNSTIATASSTSSSAANLHQQLNLLLARQQQQQGQGQAQLAAALNESLFTSNLLARLQNSMKTFPSSVGMDESLLMNNTANSLLGLSSLSQPMISASSSGSSSHLTPSQSSQLFGGFPIQPLGQGIGSLTSGNSDAAAAAQLQQQSQLLSALQQQQAQLFALQQQQPQTSQFPPNSLAASLLAQFGAANSGLNFPSCSTSSAASYLQQQPQNLLSSFINNGNINNSSNNNNNTQFGLSQPQSTLQRQLSLSTSGLQPPAGLIGGGGGAISSLSSSLDHLQSLPNTNSLLSNDAANESILAAFLSGQSIEPKIAFPPQNLPSASSSSSVTTANLLSSPALSIEQQLMRQQMTSVGQLKLPKMSSTSATAAFPPSFSSLISGSLIPGSATPMNPIEQELLMRQIRFAQQQQMVTTNGGIPGAGTNFGIGANGQQHVKREMMGSTTAGGQNTGTRPI